MLDVRRLWVLLQVARSGSFTAAAQALAYTPSAVSQQIAVLEREVGTRLVERGARGITLTEPGRILAGQAEPLFRSLLSIEQEMRAYAGLESGLLRLGWFATAGSTLVSRSIAVFHARYPGIELDLFQGDPEECLPRLLTGEIAVALVYEFAGGAPLPAGIELIELTDDPLHIGLPPGHRLAGRERIQLADLSGEHWIQGVRRGATLDVLPMACREAGFDPIISLRTEDRTVVEGLVASGAGVALIPQLTLPTVRPEIVVRPLAAKSLNRKVLVALAPDSYRPPAAAEMVQVLQESCAELSTEAARRLSRR